MRTLGILGLAALGLFALAQDAMAQRGGAMRGAVVGGMVGGEGGAAKGAKIGVVTGATRAAIDRESQTRAQYQTTSEYQSAQHANFTEAAPDSAAPAKAGSEAVIKKNGKPILGITLPADWKQRTGDNFISGVSGDGQAYAMLVTVEGAADKQAAIKKVQAGLDNYLKDIKFDDQAEEKDGALVVTGTGKAKKAGVDVVFAAALVDAGNGQLVGATFVVDSKMEDHYKETIRGICQTLRRADDFKTN